MDKKLGQEAAFPMIGDIRHNADFDTVPGMSLRTFIATQAMQGMLANDWKGYADRNPECENLAKAAVNFADALLNELNK